MLRLRPILFTALLAHVLTSIFLWIDASTSLWSGVGLAACAAVCIFIKTARQQASVWELLAYAVSFQWPYLFIHGDWQDLWIANRSSWYADFYAFFGLFIGPCTSVMVIVIASYADLARARKERLDEELVVVKPPLYKDRY